MFGELTKFVKRLYRGTCLSSGGLFLLLQEFPRIVSHTGKKQHQIAFEFAEMIATQHNWLHRRAAILVEGNKVQSPKSSSVFILFADGFAEDITRNVERSLRQVVLGKWKVK